MNAAEMQEYVALAKQYGPTVMWGAAGLAIATRVGSHLLRGKHRTTQDTTWASRTDLRKAYLLGKDGIVIGHIGNLVLRYRGRGHVFVVAATQAGKSTSLVKPTLLEPLRKTTTIIHDPKGELHPCTAPYRSTVSRVIHLALGRSVTDGYNPLDMVRMGEDEEAADLQNVASILVNPEGTDPDSEGSRHYLHMTEMVCKGLLLYGMIYEGVTHLPAFQAFFVKTQSQDMDDTVKAMLSSPHKIVYDAGAMIAGMDRPQYSGVMMTLFRALDLYGEPQMAKLLTRSDFALTDLRQGRQPLSVYLSIPFGQLARTRGFTRLFFRQCLGHAADAPEGWQKQGWHKVLCMGEEFPDLKRLEIAQDIMNHGAGLGVQLCLITPSLNNIEEIWGQHHNFRENSHVQVFFGIGDEDVAGKISKRLGEHTVMREQISVSQGRRTVTRIPTKEPLMTVSEICHMDPEQVLVIARNTQTIARQTQWDQCRPWRDRGVAA